MTGGVVSYCVNIYLWDLELLVPLPPFSPSCSEAPVSEAVLMNSASAGTAVSVSILCAPLRGMYTHLLALVCFLLPLPFPTENGQTPGPVEFQIHQWDHWDARPPSTTFLPSYFHLEVSQRCCTILRKTSQTAGTCRLL